MLYIYIYMVTFTINIPQMLAYIPYYFMINCPPKTDPLYLAGPTEG